MLERTLSAIRQGWTVVLLEPGTKRLVSGLSWEECSTRDTERVRRHLASGGGIGLDVFESGIIVLDVDVPGALQELSLAVGPTPPPTVMSPSLGVHVYMRRPEADFSPLLMIGERRIGEVIRGPRQQVVMPPTPYPGNPKRGIPPGGEYRWLRDPLPLPDLPAHWLAYLTEAQVPDYIERSAKGVPQEEPWMGPGADVLIRRAMDQPGAKRRGRGVKFQCPQCYAEGHDRHRDNAVVWNDGRWGCAWAPDNPKHKRAIGAALGVVSGESEVLGTDDLEREILDEIF